MFEWKLLQGLQSEPNDDSKFVEFLSIDNKTQVLGQSETLSISDSSLLNYQIQKLLFENSSVNENRGQFNN